MGLFSTECAYCGSRDHATDECPQGFFSKRCGRCGSTEHATSDCKHKLFSTKCSRCGSVDHATDECPQGFFSTECSRCGSKEHSTSNCVHPLFSTKCNYCGSVNHSSEECPQGLFGNKYNRRQAVLPNSESSDDYSCLGKLIGIAIVAVAIIWFVFAVAIPLILINIAILSLIVGFTKPRWSKILFLLSVIGAIYVLVDYNKGWYTKTLVTNVSFFENLIPVFFYLNLVAGLIAAFFLIRNTLNETNPDTTAEGEISKRNLLIFCCLLLVGVLIISGQKYLNSNSNEQFLLSGVLGPVKTTGTTETQTKPVDEYKPAIIPENPDTIIKTQEVVVPVEDRREEIGQAGGKQDTVLGFTGYKLQILALHNPSAIDFIRNKYNISDEIVEDFDNVWHRYFIGEFQTLNEAYDKRLIIRNRVKDAFIVKFINGKNVGALE